MRQPPTAAGQGLLLLGGGGHCRSVLDVLETAGISVAGLVTGPGEDKPVFGYPVLGGDDDLLRLRKTYDTALVTVGQIGSADVRRRLFFLLRELKYSLPAVVSPLAHVSRHARVGEGSVVMHQALVNAGVSIGENAIINTRALVEHDCAVGAHCHIAVGAVLCGGVSVGEGSFVGAGAVIRQGIRVGRGCIVGMGSTVLADVPDGAKVLGLRAARV
jgi:sugar O-acyltransferase (sialic acid O-acetyltransferase NeuD family)